MQPRGCPSNPKASDWIRVGKSENNSEARRLTAICDQQIKLWFYWEASRCECVSGAEGWREGVSAKRKFEPTLALHLLWTSHGSQRRTDKERRPSQMNNTCPDTTHSECASLSTSASSAWKPEDWRKINTCGIWKRAGCLSRDSKYAFLFSFCQTHPSDSSIKIQCLSTELFWNWTPASR